MFAIVRQVRREGVQKWNAASLLLLEERAEGPLRQRFEFFAAGAAEENSVDTE